MDTNSPAFQLIEYLNRGGNHGYYWLKFPKDNDGKEHKRTLWFPVDQPPDWPEGSYNLYFGVNPTDKIPQRISQRTKKLLSQEYVRAGLDDIAAINCLFAEFDAKHFKGGKQDARLHIENLPLPPSVLIDSGGGFHAYWLLIQPFIISNQFERDKIRKILFRWIDFVGGDPDAKDLARVLRVPGSYNYKYDPPREVTLLYSDFDMPYELADLTRLLPPEPEPKPQSTRSLPQNPQGDWKRDPLTRWLNAALDRVRPGDRQNGRNATCFWMGQQLRRDGISQSDAMRVAIDFASRVRTYDDKHLDTFPDEEAERCIQQAYDPKYPDKPPARYQGVINSAPIRPVVSQRRDAPGVTNPGRDTAAQSQPTNGNGHTPAVASTAKNGDAAQSSAIAVTTVISTVQSKTNEPEIDQSTESILKFTTQDHDGHAKCVLALYPNRFAYCEKWGWLAYDGKSWKMDGAEGAVNRAIVETLKARRVAGVKSEMEALVKSTRANSSNVNGTRELLKIYVEVFTGDFDNNPDLLNCNNGALNLRTGELLPHAPEQRFTYVIPVNYDPQADYTQWVNFVRHAVIHQEIVDYIQVALGYTLTGHTYEEVLFYLYGPPRSGKGTFTETLLSLLGGQPLCTEVDFTTFTASRNGDTQNFDLAPLKACRFVVASESDKRQPLNATKVKAFTGRNYIWCAYKHRDHFGYQPKFKIWLSSNNPIDMDVEDPAAWGRVRPIEFPNSHLGQEDKTLKIAMSSPEMLRGILRWAVEGAQIWYTLWDSKEGLPLPKIVKDLADGMRDKQDNIKAFMAECLQEIPEDQRKDTDFTISGEMYQAYKNWCERDGVPPKYHNKFTEALGNRGYKVKVIKHPITKKTVRVFPGLRLVE